MLSGLVYSPDLFLGDDKAVVAVSARFISSLVIPTTYFNKRGSFKYQHLERLRMERAKALVLHGEYKVFGRDELKKDVPWQNTERFLNNLCSTKEVVAWGESLVCCLAGCVFGASPQGILCDAGCPLREEIMMMKPGSKPAGIRALHVWADQKTSNYNEAMPESVLSRHILQINLQRYARESMRRHRGDQIQPSIMTLA